MNQLATVLASFSAERLAPYRRHTIDLAAAVRLYEWNTQVSAAWWHDIAHLEVLVRNAIHQQLSSWCERTYGHCYWYDDPGGFFTPAHTADIAAAKGRLRRLGRPEEPGRIVAELNFGFWRYVLAGHYELSLWRPSMHRAFPGQPRRRGIHERLARLHQLRNRIGHHEPIYDRPLASLHNTLMEIATWISPETADWIRAHSPVAKALTQRPNTL